MASLIFKKLRAILNDNLLLNGNFDIWQRGTPFISGGFTADRWFMYSNGSNKASRIAGNIGLDGANNAIRLQTLSSGSYPLLSQAVESDITSVLRDKSITFSFYAKKPSDSNWSGLVYGQVYYSTDSNSLANGKILINNSAFSGSLTTDSWTLYGKSFTVPKNATTLLVEISPSGALNNLSSIDITRAKLEVGSAITSSKPVGYNEELNKCKRFYQRVETVLKAGTGAGNNTRNFGVSTPLPVLPRSQNPKITIVKNNNTLIDNFNASISNDAYLNVVAESRNLYSELNVEFLIDNEIIYGKEPFKINSTSIIRDSGKIDLDWNPPIGADSSTTYTVLFGSLPNQISNTRSFVDSSGSITGLSDTSPYYFRLYSTNLYGISELSDIFQSAPLYSVPSGITSLSGTWGFDETIISWVPPSNDGGSPITGYRIDRSMYSGFPDVSTTPNFNSTFYAFVPPTGSQASLAFPSVSLSNSRLQFRIAKFSSELSSTGVYYFRVTPINLAGTGISSSLTLPKTTPSAPISLSPTAGDTTVTLNYLPPTGNGGNTISLFNLERSTSSSFTSPTSSVHTANYSPIIVSGLTNNTTYYFRMRAYNTFGYGPYTSGVLAIPNRPVTVPGAPSGVSASWFDNDTVNITWLAPTDNGGSPIINYTVYTSSGSGFTTNLLTYSTQNNITSISFDVPMTGNYNTFYFRAKANNSVGSSNNSSIASLNREAPSAPTIYQAGAGDGTVSLMWYIPTSFKGSSITGYNIQRSTSSAFTSPTDLYTTGLNSTALTISSLSNNTIYYFRVRGINSIGSGTFSSTAQATPLSPYSAPTAPGTGSLIFSPVPQSSNINMLPDNLVYLMSYRYPGTIYGVKITTPYSGGAVWGRNPYTDDSDIRTAAIHAGALTPSQTGIVYLYSMGGLSYYSGITRNGISTSSWGSWTNSYYVIGSNISCTGFTYTNTSIGSYIPILTWTTPTNNGGLAITGYEVQYAADSAFSTKLTTYTIPGNVNTNAQCSNHNDTIFYSRVRAYNSTGISPWATFPAITKGISTPSAPTSFSATALSTTGISLTWVAPVGPSGSGFDVSSNIRYNLTMTNPVGNRTFAIFNTTNGIISTQNGGYPFYAGNYALELSTKNSLYTSSPVTTTISITNTSRPTSWSFSYGYGIYGGTSAPTQAGLSDNFANFSTSVWGSNIGTGNFITADFGTSKTISNIIVGPIDQAYGGWGWSYLAGATIQYSTNGTTWTNLATITYPTNTTIFTQTYYANNITARYIRITYGTTYNWLGVGTFYFT